MRRRDSVLTARGQSFLAAGLVLLGAGAYLGLGDLLRVGTLLVVLTGALWIWARRPPRSLRVDRVVSPPRLTVGEGGHVTLTVRTLGGRRTPFLAAQEQLGYALGDRPRFLVPGLRGHRRHTVRYPVRSVLRGEHQLGPLLVRSRDALGLTGRLTRLPGHESVLVVPAVLPLTGAAVPGSGPGQDEDVADTVALHGEDDVTIRHYRQGDELRRIHWPASAHTGTLMVRQEEQPSRRRAAVVLDLRRSAHAGEGQRSSLEWAVTTAASAVAHLLAHGYDVDLATGDGVTHERPVTLDETLDILARVEPADDAQLERAARECLRRPVGVVVAVLGSGSPVGVDAVLGLRRRGTTAIALVADAHARDTGRGPRRGTTDDGELSPEAARSVIRLTGAGWRAAGATSRTTPAAAWQDAVRVGAGGGR